MLINRGRMKANRRSATSAKAHMTRKTIAPERPSRPFATPTSISRNDLMSEARNLLELYRKRNELFHKLGAGDLFGDAAWHMLIDLYLERKAGRRTSVSDLCVGSRSPQTTALRYITIMVRRGLLTRVPDDLDGRRVFVELAPHTADTLTLLFEG